jgi:hypothetical protein
MRQAMNRIPSPTTEIRENPREDEPLREALRAEVRAARLVDDGRERMRVGMNAIDSFNIDAIYWSYAPTGGKGTPAQIAKEIDFNWKAYEIAGKRDYAAERAEYDQGWEPVQHSDFPGRFAPHGTEGPVIVKDMILMWRPMRLTVQARNEEIRQATQAMDVHRRRMAEAPEGQAPRTEPTLRTSREAIEIPD